MKWENFVPRWLKFSTLSVLIFVILVFSALSVFAAGSGEIVQTLRVGKYEIVENDGLHVIQMNSDDYKTFGFSWRSSNSRKDFRVSGTRHYRLVDSEIARGEHPNFKTFRKVFLGSISARDR